ncbi:MAG: hypothetical protein J5966_09590, partial [Lachnospiraceae bacterium]|nr:hypothetical protein [Lachnospiraceae bacterium]
LYFYLSLDEVQKHENSEFVKALESKLDEDLNRPEDLAEYAFNELCFSIENFYGFPGKAMLNDDIREEGLEKALNDYSEAGKKTVELLKSPGITDYLYGMSKLGLFLNDGGHTYLTWTLPKDFEDEGIREEYDKLAKELDPLFEEVQSEADKRKMDVSEYLARRKMRNDSYDGSRYLKDGDTAVFVLDSFMGFDMEAWSAYYDGEGDKPTADTVSGDDIVLIHDALIDADKDPDIVNFVIDCSNNTGGSADEVAMLVSLITGERETEIRLEDTQTGQIRTEVYEADTNFDGSFDEEDDFEPYDLNFAILTSSTSFSCGNLFPALMREKGYMIMGERSGGGACAVMQQTTGDGLNYQMSSCRMKLLDIEGSSIDNGIPVDVDLVPKKSDGSDKTVLEKDVLLSKEDGPQELRVIDYSEFYIIERLSDEINGFYEEEAAEDKAA